jgi:hypothetical protein
MPPLDDSTTPDSPAMFRPTGDGSRVASPHAWNEAAVMIAGGAPLRSVAAGRFRGLHAAAVDAIEAAVRRGDLRAAFWVADRLGLAKTDVGDARAGLAIAEDAAAWGEGPPVDAALFALDAPLTLEPEVEAELAGPPAAVAGPPAAVNEGDGKAETIAKAPPAAPRETSARRRSRTFHKAPPAPVGLATRNLPPVTDLLKHLPRTAAAWPAMPLAATAGLAPPDLRRAG